MRVETIGRKSAAAAEAGLGAPPNDMIAEQCVLGAMLLSVDAVGEVVEVVVGADFYRPAHEQIFGTIVDLYGRGEPVDPVTVAAALGRCAVPA